MARSGWRSEHRQQNVADDPGDLLRAVTCMYTNTPGHHFVVGPHPEHPQVAAAGGFSRHGFKFAPRR